MHAGLLQLKFFLLYPLSYVLIRVPRGGDRGSEPLFLLYGNVVIQIADILVECESEENIILFIVSWTKLTHKIPQQIQL